MWKKQINPYSWTGIKHLVEDLTPGSTTIAPPPVTSEEIYKEYKKIKEMYEEYEKVRGAIHTPKEDILKARIKELEKENKELQEFIDKRMEKLLEGCKNE